MIPHMVICTTGLIGSGKSEISRYLVKKYKFHEISFAESLKEVVGSIFGWDINMLKGDTIESRLWREKIDPWWANRLDIPHLSPRWAMQNIGTEIFRQSFHNDIWIASLQKKMLEIPNDINVVISDGRFMNELNLTKSMDGYIFRCERGERPDWYQTASEQMSIEKIVKPGQRVEDSMANKYPQVHRSEWESASYPADEIIINDGTLGDLQVKVDSIIERYSEE